MKITLAQVDPVVGDITGNTARLLNVVEQYNFKTDLIVFPELYLTGYPPRDLLEKPGFIKRTREALQEILLASKAYPDLGILFGMPLESDFGTGKGLYNSAVLVCGGEVLFKQNKSLLPFYDVFDESRYFDTAPGIETVIFKGSCLGITICEDAWNISTMHPAEWKYFTDPQQKLSEQGAEMFINISASPYYLAKEDLRYEIFRHHAVKYGIPFVYVNQIGANDELVFDGRSMVIDKQGEILQRLPAFREAIVTVDTEDPPKSSLEPEQQMESLFNALVLGVRDYFKKTGFIRAIIGLSGGVDSALTAVLATEALGRENVLGISMPSRYSSEGSVADSRSLAKNLGIELKIIPIMPVYEAYMHSLKDHFAGKEPDVTEENIQARIRGNLLMAFSNKLGGMVLSTGNKSELAVGYCTLYGDMCGGLCVLSDVPKTMVYKLSRYINKEKEIIPIATLEKEPSAELRPDQKDQDTLPPYEVLDAILNDYIEENLSIAEIIYRGYDPDTVKWVVRAVNHNEYKRKQAAPGIKVSSKAFGMGRRIPIAAKFEV
ncbi:MAG TPA: NAD+ synthase [Syntrophomonadaceae bacterium]|nr:NAD+ synthase [Syntrophomonadaceae bacterium]HPR92617.1 NAD+ synthase [Syntrophomonadaceae bacterium]